MINKPKNILMYAFIVGLVVISVISYLNFTNYQPKILKKVGEVKGIKKTSEKDIVYPTDAEKISSTQTNVSSQATFKTSKSQNEVESFYKFIFSDLGWDIESVTSTQDSLILKYKKPGSLATIIAQKDLEKTLVSIEISPR